MNEPQGKRVIAFVDGQNLFNAAKMAFGYSFPNFDPTELAKLVCNQQSDARTEHWTLVKLHFYTGMPSQTKDETRNRFWKIKLLTMSRNNLVQTYSRPLVYRNGVGQEKGIDVKLAIDAVRLAHESAYDVALIFSQDQDFVEVATEIRRIGLPLFSWCETVLCRCGSGGTETSAEPVEGREVMMVMVIHWTDR